jgi:hypothetical protein
MKLKFNWGTWIVVSFILFAAGTFVMVYISMSTDVDLVTEDYYEKELKYQDHIDLVKGTNALDGQVAMEFSDTMLRISFPAIGARETYSGAIQFFRPSDKKSDFILPVSVDSSYSQSIPVSLFAKGLWRVKIAWNVGKQNYYSEQPVLVQ